MRIEIRRLLSILFPARCVGCGLRGVDICDRCLLSIRSLDSTSCPRCGGQSAQGGLCRGCRRYRGPLAGIRSAGVYEGVLRNAIHQYKYRHRQGLSVPLAGLVETELRRRPLHVDLLVPVPLHPHRLRQRGYNQAELLAIQIGDTLDIPVWPCLERRLDTVPQAGLRASERRKNTRDVFGLRGAGEMLAGRRVGVVDDVCTTGATLEGCARVLVGAGCKSVWGIVVARDI